MLDAAEIRKEIARLEYEESDYKNYAKLADLYVIRKQMQEVCGLLLRRSRPCDRRTGYRWRVRGQ